MGNLVVHQVSKAYRRYSSPWSRAREWLLGDVRHEARWALRDISFEVPAGSAVGIVGVNGAGKSTLLKIITGTTTPTTGHVSVEGRIAAILELGLGFHPEFSGRQNALMSGQMLGLSLQEVEQAMPSIEAFAGIGDYMDQPVRTYSSGMQMRLAFSVATAVRPDVLIVDEALAVGDAAFQRKCFQRLEQFRAEGTTLLFVSHDIEAVKRLCEQAVFIHEGKVAAFGVARQVCDAYERVVFGGAVPAATTVLAGSTTTAGGQLSPADEAVVVDDVAATVFDPDLVTGCEQIYGGDEAVIERCWLEDQSGRVVNTANTHDSIYWCFDVRFDTQVQQPVLAMMLKTADGHAVFGTDSTFLEQRTAAVSAGARRRARFAITLGLAPGNYFLNCGVRRDDKDGSVFLARRVDAAILKVRAGARGTAAVGPADLAAVLTIDDDGT